LAEKVDALRLSCEEGDIQVTAAPEGAKDEILIVAEKIITGSQSEKRLAPYAENVKVSAALEGKTLAIQERWEGKSSRRIRYRVNYRITAPRRLALTLHSTSGALEVKGMSGAVDASSDSGGMEFRQTTGALNAVSSSGSIRAEDIKTALKVSLASSSGALEAKGLEAGEALLKTKDGAITLAGCANAVTLISDDGAIAAELPSERQAQSFQVRTDNGSIDLKIPASWNATLQAKTESGSIKLEQGASSREEDHLLEMKLGQGGAPFQVQSGEGAISVQVH
jgi:DUF4097 and DUF4098 domain-containing protein YvlB